MFCKHNEHLSDINIRLFLCTQITILLYLHFLLLPVICVYGILNCEHKMLIINANAVTNLRELFFENVTSGSPSKEIRLFYSNLTIAWSQCSG